MSRILICTEVGDVHGASIHLALQKMGHESLRWFSSDLPQLDAMSFKLNGDNTSLLCCGDERMDLHSFDTVWNRRLGNPLPSSELTEADWHLAERECGIFLNNMLLEAASHGFWVNPPEPASRVEQSKLSQLLAAKRLGWQIPTTLISNDPSEIRDFLRSSKPHQVVVKPFRPVVWHNEAADATAITMTAVLEEDAMPSDWLLRQCPSIFQQRVIKDHELRVTCLGATVIAARLNSQALHPRGQLDWRLASLPSLGVEEVELPEQVRSACIGLMHELGLVFGCIDLIVTKDQEYVFLEVNQMGQFLWVEEANPNIPLLDAFCQFLIAGHVDFAYDRSRQKFTLEEFQSASHELTEIDERHHRQYKASDLRFHEVNKTFKKT